METETQEEQEEIDWTTECVCNAWIVDGEIFTIYRINQDPDHLRSFEETREEGYDPECPFHQAYPDTFYDRDMWADHVVSLQEKDQAESDNGGKSKKTK